MRYSLSAHLAVLVLATAFVSTGCRKEPRSAPNDLTAGLTKVSGLACAEGVKLECGIPFYQDSAHFEEVYECLEYAYETWQNDFESTYGYLSEDEYEDMASILNWVDEQPLLDFESANGYLSYRANLVLAEELWLASGAAEPSPWVNDVFVDEVMGTMFNKDGAA